MRESVSHGVCSTGDFHSGSPQPRIAFLTNMIPPYHKPILDRLASRYPGFRVFLSTPMESNRSWKLEWDGLDVVVQKTVTLNGRWRHPRGFSEPLYVHLPLDTVRQLKDFRADIVISGEFGTRTILAAIYRRLHPWARLIVWAEIAEATEHGRGWSRQLVRRVLHRGVDAFLVTGESGIRYLRSLGVVDRKMFKIAYTTSVDRFAAVCLDRFSENAYRLLYVGQLIERKGLSLFLEALAKWAAVHAERTINFSLVGEGPLRMRLEHFPLPPNLRLTFLGNVNYEDLPHVYAEGGIFVLPSLADTWAVVVNEAMASGLPVLGSLYAQAVSELVNEQNGWTFRPDMEAELAEAIDRSLTTPPEDLNRMRKCARDTALSITPEVVTDSIDAAIRACLRSANAVIGN